MIRQRRRPLSCCQFKVQNKDVDAWSKKWHNVRHLCRIVRRLLHRSLGVVCPAFVYHDLLLHPVYLVGYWNLVPIVLKWATSYKILNGLFESDQTRLFGCQKW
jgi:hypothetical protein